MRSAPSAKSWQVQILGCPACQVHFLSRFCAQVAASAKVQNLGKCENFSGPRPLYFSAIPFVKYIFLILVPVADHIWSEFRRATAADLNSSEMSHLSHL